VCVGIVVNVVDGGEAVSLALMLVGNVGGGFVGGSNGNGNGNGKAGAVVEVGIRADSW
jgi:hypothetical protein